MKTLSVAYSKLYFIEKQDIDFINKKTPNSILKKPPPQQQQQNNQRKQDRELSGSSTRN